MPQKLRMHDWDTWQTYRKDRATPPWIKVHRNIFSTPKWANLSDAEKGQLVSMWVMAANSDGQLPYDANMIRKVCMLDNLPDLNKFIELGWIDIYECQDDAKMTPSGRQDDTPDTKAKAEVDNHDLDDTWTAAKKVMLSIRPEAFDEDACRNAWRKVAYNMRGQFCAAMPMLAKSKDWYTCEAKFVPNFSKVITQGTWKNIDLKPKKQELKMPCL